MNNAKGFFQCDKVDSMGNSIVSIGFATRYKNDLICLINKRNRLDLLNLRRKSQKK